MMKNGDPRESQSFLSRPGPARTVRNLAYRASAFVGAVVPITSAAQGLNIGDDNSNWLLGGSCS